MGNHISCNVRVVWLIVWFGKYGCVCGGVRGGAWLTVNDVILFCTLCRVLGAGPLEHEAWFGLRCMWGVHMLCVFVGVDVLCFYALC